MVGAFSIPTKASPCRRLTSTMPTPKQSIDQNGERHKRLIATTTTITIRLAPCNSRRWGTIRRRSTTKIFYSKQTLSSQPIIHIHEEFCSTARRIHQTQKRPATDSTFEDLRDNPIFRKESFLQPSEAFHSFLPRIFPRKPHLPDGCPFRDHWRPRTFFASIPTKAKTSKIPIRSVRVPTVASRSCAEEQGVISVTILARQKDTASMQVR
mmetsp:Transcript_16380/g.35615  ORF Transcript_16380/g.35615 Transcript_16380/m.35615 type:complete len:210 (+) Transcript_16380:437-1066(+)